MIRRPGRGRATGSLGTARSESHGDAAALGKVLVAGGLHWSAILSSAELYDPATGTWTATGSLGTARADHTATLLPTGKVLVAGGDDGSGYLSSAELYDPASGTWTATGSLGTARVRSHGDAAALRQGAGGGRMRYQWCRLSSAELYDPAAGTWTATGSLATARDFTRRRCCPQARCWWREDSTAVMVLLSSAELYDPATGRWTAHRQPRHRTPLSHGDAAALRQGAGGGGRLQWRSILPEQRGAVRSGQRERGRRPAASPPHASITRRRCCPSARCWWQGENDNGGI